MLIFAPNMYTCGVINNIDETFNNSACQNVSKDFSKNWKAQKFNIVYMLYKYFNSEKLIE